MLPTYDAIRFIKILESGRTHPLLLECELENDDGVETGTFVVKAPGLPEVEDFGLFVETLGYLIAQELEVEVPRPAIVRLSHEFAEITNDVIAASGISINPGIGFGSEHQGSGVIPVSPDLRIGADQLSNAADIFCYDLLIQNPDRHPGNPNCLLKSGRLIAFDFNTAFSFLLLVGSENNPWEFVEHRIHERHLFYHALKGREIDLKTFVERISRISESALDQMLAAIPFSDGHWDQKVQDHFKGIRDNLVRLEMEFARCLV